MILSDHMLLQRLRHDPPLVNPLGPYAVQPASIDIRLGGSFAEYINSDAPIDPMQPQDNATRTWEADEHLLYPGRFLLATTREQVHMPDDLVAHVDGKSSIGRLGLLVHVTAGLVDPGFRGEITLEMLVVGPRPVLLRRGMRIAQLVFSQMTTPAVRPYGHEALGSRYQDQRGATPSRISW